MPSARHVAHLTYRQLLCIVHYVRLGRFIGIVMPTTTANRSCLEFDFNFDCHRSFPFA